jgi:hypothetical protein
VGDNARFDTDFAVPVGHSWHPLVDILSPEFHGVSFALLPFFRGVIEIFQERANSSKLQQPESRPRD